MATFVMGKYLRVEEPKRKYWLWGKDVCPKCRKELTIHWDEPVVIDFTIPPLGKRMSWVTYSCTCGYLYCQYEDNYGMLWDGKIKRIAVM